MRMFKRILGWSLLASAVLGWFLMLGIPLITMISIAGAWLAVIGFVNLIAWLITSD